MGLLVINLQTQSTTTLLVSIRNQTIKKATNGMLVLPALLLFIVPNGFKAISQ